MTISFARLLSFLFNPVFLLIFVPFFLIYKSTQDISAAVTWTFYTVGFLLVLGVFMVSMVKRRVFTDLDVSKREQRPLLFLFSVILMFFYLLGLSIFQAPFILFFTSFGVVVGLFAVSYINQHIKASLHVGTITAVIVAFVLGYGGWYSVLLLLIPLIAWARLKVKRHTLSETIAGGIFGSVLAAVLYLLIKLVLSY